MDILKLNTDVLLIIFENLSPQDLLSVARASEDFKKILRFCRVPHLNIIPLSEINKDGMSPADFELLMQHVGRSVKSIEICNNHALVETNRYTSSIAANCGNLRTLELTFFNFNSLIPLKETFKSLETLYLTLNMLDDIDLTRFLFPDPLPKIKYLRFNTLGRELDCLDINAPNIETVIFEQTTLIYFDKFLAKCSKLKHISLAYCDVPDYQLYVIPKLLPGLEYFSMKSQEYYYDLSSFSILGALQKVRLTGENLIVDPFLTEISKMDKLISLKLDQVQISPDTVMALAKTHNLQKFSVTAMEEFGNLHVEAMFGNRFREIRMFAITAQPYVIKELALKSVCLKVFDINGMNSMKKETYNEIKAANPEVYVRVPVGI